MSRNEKIMFVLAGIGYAICVTLLVMQIQIQR